MRWEYRTITLACENEVGRDPPVGLAHQAKLNALGAEEWELVAAIPVPDFDVDAWIEELRDRAKGKRQAAPMKELTEDEAIGLLGNQTETTTGVRRLLRKTGIPRDDADDLVKRIVASGRWVAWRPAAKNPPTYIGPAAAMKARCELWAKQQQGELPG